MPGSVTNISSLDDFSGSGNYSIVDEFPYWRLAMAVRVVTVVFVYFPTAVFLNGSVLLAFIVTKKLHRSINLMHIALIIELFLVKYLGIFCGLLSFPNGIRFCICWDLVNEIYLTLTSFNVAFVGVVLTCLSVTQLLIIRGKKKLVSWKVVTVLVVMSTIYSLLLAVVSFVGNRLQNTPLLCASLCRGTSGSMFSNFSFSLIGLVVVVLLPCVVVTFSTLLWSCFIFKSSYIGGDDQLSRRIVSLPAIMPILTIFTTVLFFMVQQLVVSILRQSVTSFFPNWVIFCAEIQGYLYEGIGGFIYPLVLLYFNPQLRSAWKTMLKDARVALWNRCVGKKEKRSSRVHPEPPVVDPGTDSLTMENY